MPEGLSVVIAAHNEAAGIEATLRSLLANRLDRPLQIIVVANGCTDDTAQIARQVSPSIEVLETPIGNKIHALNLGDRAARYFPRAYLDADCQTSPNLLQEVIHAFEDPAIRIVAPGVQYACESCNPFLRGYYQLWKSLPYVRRNTMARGFYAIDEKLRKRFAEFPALTADDKFIRNLTSPEERRVVPTAHTIVRLPNTFADLLRVKTRWTYGNLELAQRRPELNVNDRNEHEGAIPFVLARPWLWVNLPAFLYVWRRAKRDALRQLRANQPTWERDDSTRRIAAA